jgi:hypothetical protein
MQRLLVKEGKWKSSGDPSYTILTDYKMEEHAISER